MKTTLLFSAAFLLTMASFAQTTVNNQETAKSVSKVQNDKGSKQIKGSTTASTSTNIESTVPAKTEQKANTAAENEKKTVSAEKKEIAKDGKKNETMAKDVVDQDHSASAAAGINDHISASAKDNKTSEFSSLNGQASVSTKDAKATGNQAKGEGKTVVRKTTEMAQTVKPKPAVIKMNSQLKTSSVIKIK